MPENDFYEICSHFVEKTMSSLGFLQSDYGAQVSSGRYDFETHTLKKLRSPLKAFFSVKVEFLMDFGKLFVTYGDREFCMDVRFLRDRIEYGLWEIFDANGLDANELMTENFLMTKERMDLTLENIANLLRKNMDILIVIDNRIQMRIEKARKKRQQEWLDSMRKRDLESKYSEARKKMITGTPEVSYNLLKPFQDLFSASQRKLFEMVKKKAGK